MTLATFKQTGFKLIKVISAVLILSAIALELWNLYVLQRGEQLPNISQIPLWFSHIALSAHFIEGTIAAFYALKRDKNPFSYGVYTFFVGTMGLVELFEF